MLANIRSIRMKHPIERRSKLYSASLPTEEALRIQLDLFNKLWPVIKSYVPLYRKLALQEKLPNTFKSWEEIMSSFPIVTRNLVQEKCGDLYDRRRRPQWYRTTGGSTAQPVQLPAWYSENDWTSPDMWLGRSWYGVEPTDRLFMIWGHSHLLGKGTKGMVNRILRQAKDRLLGYYRFSAYNMDETSMKKAGEAMIRFRPDYIIGYSRALDAFARSNLTRSNQLRRVGIKVAIGAAEGFPANDSVELIEQVIGAPVAMEYGSVETGLIAHTHPNESYRTFWRTYFVEARENGLTGKSVRVTALFPRCFPLIRYDIGDEIELYPGDSGIGVQRFRRVIGRCNDFLLLPDGSKIHSELVTHAVRSAPEITGYQAIQEADHIRLLVTASLQLPDSTIAAIRKRLGVIHPYFNRISIEKAEKLQQSIAGKTPIVIRK